jgi:D-alanyl-D-alanine carboxypeptidase (penicillin-binding protein 5/6)
MVVNVHIFRRAVAGRAVLTALVALVTALAAEPVRAQPIAPAVAKAAAPEVTAQAIYAVDITAGVELMELNADERLPPASTAKLASVIVILETLERLGLTTEEPVVIDQADVTIDGESTMNLVAGDTLTVEQLLYGMLLPSGNDAARTMARYTGNLLLTAEGAGGDPAERFIAEMNALCARLGMQQTVFVDPAGRNEGNVSTARELATLTAEILGYPLLREIIDTKALDLVSIGPEARFYSLLNTNEMLGEDGIHGVKTGTLDRANLIVQRIEHGRNRVIAIVLGSDVEFDADGFKVVGSDRRYDDMRAVLAALDASFDWIDPSQADEIPGLADELAAWEVELADGASIVAPAGADGDFRYQLELGPEGVPGEPVGRVLFFVGSTPVTERPVLQLDE